MKVVCSYCYKDTTTGEDHNHAVDPNVSHGVCKECHALVMDCLKTNGYLADKKLEALTEELKGKRKHAGTELQP